MSAVHQAPSSSKHVCTKCAETHDIHLSGIAETMGDCKFCGTSTPWHAAVASPKMEVLTFMGRPTCLACAHERQIPTMLSKEPPLPLSKRPICQFGCGMPSLYYEKIEVTIPAPEKCPLCNVTAVGDAPLSEPEAA